MKRRSFGLHAALPLLAASCLFFRTSDASAIEFGTPATKNPYRSAQNFALELRFSPYYPRVDDEPGLNGTPFRDRFGTADRFYIGLEFDWQMFRIPYLGTIGPGLGVGRVAMSRPSVTLSGRPSSDEYSLEIFPLYLSAVLRADVIWRELRVPLVPYGKVGLGTGLWTASNTGGTSRSQLPGETKAVSGDGITLGTHLALGAAFALDSIDQGATRNADNAIGINGTYLYAEYYWLNLNGLGQEGVLYVGANTWAAGMMFEF